MSRHLRHRFDFLVSRRFDTALAVSAATLGYLSHEKDAYPKPTDRLVPLLKQHVHREYPSAAYYWDQAEQAVDRVVARLPSLPSLPSAQKTADSDSKDRKVKLDGGDASASPSTVDEEKTLQQWMAQLATEDSKETK